MEFSRFFLTKGRPWRASPRSVAYEDFLERGGGGGGGFSLLSLTTGGPGWSFFLGLSSFFFCAETTCCRPGRVPNVVMQETARRPIVNNFFISTTHFYDSLETVMIKITNRLAAILDPAVPVRDTTIIFSRLSPARGYFHCCPARSFLFHSCQRQQPGLFPFLFSPACSVRTEQESVP